MEESKSRSAARTGTLAEFGIDPRTLATDARPAVEALAEEITQLREQRESLARELEAARRLADSDPLCPVFNRRAFLRELQREIAVSQRHGSTLSLLFIDLVAFKQINDLFGHAAGDDVLKSVAETLVESVRQTDIVGRIGGDEFGIALTRATLGDARAKADMLAARLSEIPVTARDDPGQPDHTLTASFGFAEWDEGLDADALLARADADMYRSRDAERVAE